MRGVKGKVEVVAPISAPILQMVPIPKRNWGWRRGGPFIVIFGCVHTVIQYFLYCAISL